MSITVKDCLKLPSLSLGTVVAGKNGLNRIVNSISVVEFNFSDDEDLTSNEFLISAFYTVRDDVSEQCRLIRKYKKRGEVGLILFYADYILGKLDQEVIETANQLDFPIILLPGKDTGLRYSDVISEVMEAVITDRNHNNFFINNTMERLAQLPPHKRTLNSPLILSSEYTRASFFLCDRKNNVIASSFWPKNRYFSLEDVISQFNDTTETKDRSQREYLKKEFITKEGLQLTLYAVSKNKMLTAADLEQIIEIIQLFAAVWNYNLNLMMKEALIPALIENDSALISHLCKTHHIHLSDYNATILFQLNRKNTENADHLHMISELRKLFSEYGKKSIIDRYGNDIVAFSSILHSSAKDRLLTEALNRLTAETSGLCSTVFLTGLSEITEIRKHYLEYIENIEAAKVVYPEKKMFEKSDLRFIQNCRTILQTPDNSAEEYLSLLEPLRTNSDPELLKTIAVYFLDAESEVKKTAALLYLHRNTVQYRLTRIKDLLGTDFTRPPASIHAYTALALYRLTEENTENTTEKARISS